MIRQVRLAGGPGRLDEVAPSQRQRLRAQHARTPRPRRCTPMTSATVPVAGARQRWPVMMMMSGSAGITRKTLDERRQRLVADAAEVAGGDTDQRSTSDGRDDAGDEADEHDAAGADQDLAEDVLPEVGGAEPVLRTTAPAAGRCCARSGRTARSTAR